jgi:DNA-binding beta-propeller fold protein YncE
VANYNASYISVINGATCNAANLSGCGHATAMTATSPTGDLAIDQGTGTVFADQSFYGSEVFVFDGAGCNAHVTTGCHQPPVVVPVGGWPGDLAAIPATHTLYVTDNVDGEASYFGY